MAVGSGNRDIRTTLLIPCYNESDGIPQLCAHLRALAPQLIEDGEVEVVFVDDGSLDGTATVIHRHAHGLNYRIVPHDRNRGLGAALRTGFASATGREIVTLDSDCTYDPMRSIDLLRLLREGYDVVTGSPYHPEGHVLGVQGWRLFLSKSLSRLYWLVLPQHLYTYTSCFRAYRTETVAHLDLQNDGFLGVTQLIVSAILRGYKVAELPATLSKRRFGQSKIRVVRVIISHLKYLSYVIYLRLTHGIQGVH